MNQPQAKDLFQLQTELIDMKVDMAVSKTIDHAIEKLSGVMTGVRDELRAEIRSVDKRISSVEHRLVAVETKLGIKHVTYTEIRNRFLDYGFKVGSAIIGGAIMSGIMMIYAWLIK
jgi:hypothetical protein